MTGCGQRGAGSVRDVRVGGGSSEDGRGERPARAGAAGFRRPARLLLLALAALAIVGTPQAQAQTDIWSATLTVGSAYGSLGYADGAGGSLSPTNSFTLGSTNYRVDSLLRLSSGLSLDTRPSLSAEVASNLTLNVGGRSLPFADASFSAFGGARWSFSPALGWSVGETVLGEHHPGVRRTARHRTARHRARPRGPEGPADHDQLVRRFEQHRGFG